MLPHFFHPPTSHSFHYRVELLTVLLHFFSHYSDKIVTQKKLFFFHAMKAAIIIHFPG
jgi:hypothetical protein